jgi:flagellum-specific ATP synthase
MMALARLDGLVSTFFGAQPILKRGGRVIAVSPHFFRVGGLEGHVCLRDAVIYENGGGPARGEVVQISQSDVLVSPYREIGAIRLGDMVFHERAKENAPGFSWLGRTFNALGELVDGKGPLLEDSGKRTLSSAASANHSIARDRVQTPFRTGVRVIDVFAPLCYGQRIGIFAGSGVGKSTLLSMLAKSDAFDAVVIALVGERGREVREFLEDTIGDAAMAKTVAIVATSDESALMRRAAPELAMQAAEHFRESGMRVLLLVDSVTRYAHALREVRISAGEPPIARGYPASVFTDMPKLLERAGPGTRSAGSVTAIFSVLIDGDDHNDPVADAVRGYLDGHIVLDRNIADQGRYPPVNPVASLSRLAPRVWSAEEKKLVMQLKAIISRFEETRDLRLLGAWQPGNDEMLDRAVATVPMIYQALCQSPSDPPSADPFAELVAFLKERQNVNEAARQHVQT